MAVWVVLPWRGFGGSWSSSSDEMTMGADERFALFGCLGGSLSSESSGGMGICFALLGFLGGSLSSESSGGMGTCFSLRGVRGGSLSSESSMGPRLAALGCELPFERFVSFEKPTMIRWELSKQDALEDEQEMADEVWQDEMHCTFHKIGRCTPLAATSSCKLQTSADLYKCVRRTFPMLPGDYQASNKRDCHMQCDGPYVSACSNALWISKSTTLR